MDDPNMNAYEESLMPRCQAIHPEGGQCELREGHEFSKHLAGMIVWRLSESKPAAESAPSDLPHILADTIVQRYLAHPGGKMYPELMAQIEPLIESALAERGKLIAEIALRMAAEISDDEAGDCERLLSDPNATDLGLAIARTVQNTGRAVAAKVRAILIASILEEADSKRRPA